MAIQPIILAGGTGSRLWPLSRELYPKQVISLTGELSLLQTTIKRVAELEHARAPIVVVGEEHRFMTKSQLEELELFKDFQILLEPMGKNTAPAICGAAAFVARQGHGEDTLLVLPADHLITRPEIFAQAVERAVALAEQGMLVTFGIVPDHPETGYGYIAKGEGGKVERFVEKPDLVTAQAYLTQGGYLWNSGMFTFSAQTLLAEMQLYAPEVVECMAEAVEQGRFDGVFFRFNREIMASCPSDSIDYALMEKTRNAAVVEADIGWSDIGSWQALWEVADKDERGNVAGGDVLLEDVENSLVRSEHTLVAAVGLKNTMVIETADAVLVAPMDRSQDVKKIVTRLKREKRGEFQVHKTVYRPWGSYTTLEMQDRFQIKRITVNPGAKLSLQMHHHRHEHWVVVSGTARVVNGEESILLQEDQSTYIPSGTRHRLENPGVIPLELIEVQIGSYLGEDDIVRFDDDYGRQEE
ncbi:mannose-1-phosphate guanylyltransferase/mannose-6-phosphate isomerase [Desulfogranum mediterraneum]|uniref:mannose-1-phosphate guanylyltransferase/mannose-6-phosphate isomerase n=1 Tax=Desulfogranum mediterraneum TaxID=160661 RepID=UPI000413CD72|nr:mannose-1-phosphate guanylyltransferase/mannose-6-phosphate isomerase [Desulfogranum mediterraneum]